MIQYFVGYRVSDQINLALSVTYNKELCLTIEMPDERLFYKRIHLTNNYNC